MATMIDCKPEYLGEAKLWSALNDYLPDNIIVYNTREINGREFDSCLLLEDCGALIIEVKGWLANKITVKGVDEIEIEGYSDAQRSPKKQARAYRFALLNLIKQKFDASPLVLDMVCYPFITKEEYYQSHLDIICEETFVLFKEDLESEETLLNKIKGVFQSFAYIPHTEFSDRMVSKVRQLWEPDYKIEEDTQVTSIHPYSLLYLNHGRKDNAYRQQLLDCYFSGTKIIAFFDDKDEFNETVTVFDEAFAQKNLEPSFNGLDIGYTKGFRSSNAVARTFNCEFYYLDAVGDIGKTEMMIIEGAMSSEEQEALKALALISSFNYQQYIVEHADTETNILVQAGAGTGKTYSMVSRVAFLCNKLDNPIREIDEELALVTFTNDAAINMKVRLKQMFKNYYLLTGNPEYIKLIEDVERAHVSTIHKLSFDILRKLSIHLGLGNNFAISSDEFSRGKIYDAYLTAFLYVKETDNPTFINELTVPVYELKKKSLALADKLMNKSVNLGKITASDMGETVEGQLPYFNELIEKVIIPAEIEYFADRHNHNLVDLKECITLLEAVLDFAGENFNFLKFRYLFIDEFQDTDDVQIKVFKKLQTSMAQTCKLFVVGDLKQSIYRFRGAQLSAFDQLKDSSDLKWNDYYLTTNYRTDHRLLEQLGDIFENMGCQGYLPYNAKVDKLDSFISKDIEDDEILTEVDYWDTFDDELVEVIGHQKEVLQTAMERGSLNNAERTIAILCRSNWQVEKIAGIAKSKGVELIATSGDDLYLLESTKDLYKLVMALENSHDPVCLVDFLNSYYSGIKLDFQQLHGLSKEDTLKQLELVLDALFMARMKLDWKAVIELTSSQPILFVLKQIYDSLAPWKQYSYSQTGQEYYRSNYDYLLEQIINFAKVDGLTLNRIAQFLKINILSGQKKTARGIPQNDEIKVICTTIHSSKGLEYGTVIIPYTHEDMGDMRKAKLDINYSKSKLSYLVCFDNDIRERNSNYSIALESDEQIAEESRILYVALTRAIRNCVWFKNINGANGLDWASLLEA